ncbi:MAG: mercuric reductase [Bacteroidetes bacterium]|nr:MAG: mercuric reductase [Bacteroidota bacterium]
MNADSYDIVVLGAGSGGLSVGLTMNKLGFKVLMVAKTDKAIGGDCLNEGCVPSKALIYVSRILHNVKMATAFGLKVDGKPDLQKAIEYIYSRQEIIRQHENAQWLKDQGIAIELGEAKFSGEKEIEVNGQKYRAKNIVIATGSSPKKLNVPGIELVRYFDNESVFHADNLPEHILVIGGGPIGIEIAQALRRFEKKVTVVHHGKSILEHDDETVTSVLLQKLQQEGIEFWLSASIECFTSFRESTIKLSDGTKRSLFFDAVFVAIGRELHLQPLQLEKAGIEVMNYKIVVDDYLRTTNKNVFLCGDIAGGHIFSHEAEFHARILVNNFLSPFKRKLNNDHLSWVTFTDPEIAAFGVSEKQLVERRIKYKRLEADFCNDDRAVVDNYQFGKLILLISEKRMMRKERILGGTMIAPGAGELVQELILANSQKLSVIAIFNKIYPYPVGARINQALIVQHMEEKLTRNVKSFLRIAYRFWG